jgi:4-hydroxybenzoate polyprenyltransferase
MSAPQRFEWLAFFRLLRLPNVFTAWSDVLMGFLVAQGAFPTSVGGLISLGLLVGATTGLYLGGMVLNDWFDFAEDQKARSFRPLPSGKFSLRFAATLGFGLLIIGVVFAASAGVVWKMLVIRGTSSNLVAVAPPAVLGVAIAIAVLAYNSFLKKTLVGPISMGLCRTLNILLGMSLVSPLDTGWSSLVFSAPQLVLAAGIGVYIAGVTWFARREEIQSPRVGLLFGFVVLALGVLLLAMAPDFGVLPTGRIVGPQYRWLMLLVGGVVGARCLRAIADPQPSKVQMAIKIAILSLIWLDAAIALRVSSFQEALCIALLIVPAMLVGRAVYST